MIKNLLFLIAGISIISSSCGDDNDPDYITYPPITKQYPQKNKILNWNSVQPIVKEEIQSLIAQPFLVNDIADLPSTSLIDDNFKEMDLPLEDHSLIISYELLGFRPLTYEYGWGHNTQDNNYIFYIHTTYNSNDEEMKDYDVCLSRNAILVKKIPDGTKIKAVSTTAVSGIW